MRRTRDRLRTGLVVRYASGELAVSGFVAVTGLVLVFYMTDSLGIPVALAGLTITIAKLWDVLVDPLIGSLSDRALAATGSRRGFMRVAIIALPVFFVVTFAVPDGLGPLVSAAWVLVAFLLASTAFSLFQVPYTVLPAELVAGYDDRTRLISIRVIGGAFAVLLLNAGGPALRSLAGDDVALGYILLAAGSGFVFAIGMAIVSGIERAGRGASTPAPPVTSAYAQLATPRDSLGVKFRRSWGTLRTSQPFRTLLPAFVFITISTGMALAAAQYLATWVLGGRDLVAFIAISFIAPALVVAPVWGGIARRIGKERTFVIAIVLFAASVLCVLPAVWWPGPWIYAPIAVSGVAFAGLRAMPLAMLPDVISHDARRNGAGRGGAFGGIWTAAEGLGLTVGATIVTAILAVTGYTESVDGGNAAQTPLALLGIVVSSSLVPALITLLALIPLARYPLRRGDADANHSPLSLIPGVPPSRAPLPDTIGR
jgi:GPH family glycoside/pentoside/hexuronide:cation symporter